MPTARVDLAAIDIQVEIVVRAGDAHIPEAHSNIQEAYKRLDVVNYPDAPGISTLFKIGATVDELAREGLFPHKKISWTTIERLVDELAKVDHSPVLFITPAPELGLPDHHSLAVAHQGVVQPILADDVAEALLRALSVMDNPYRRG